MIRPANKRQGFPPFQVIEERCEMSVELVRMLAEIVVFNVNVVDQKRCGEELLRRGENAGFNYPGIVDYVLKKGVERIKEENAKALQSN